MRKIEHDMPDEVYDIEKGETKALKINFVTTPGTKEIISRLAAEQNKPLSTFMIECAVSGYSGKTDIRLSVKNCIEDKSCNCIVCRTMRLICKVKTKERHAWQARLSNSEYEVIKKKAGSERGISAYVLDSCFNFKKSREKNFWRCLEECGCPVCTELRKGLSHSEQFSELLEENKEA